MLPHQKARVCCMSLSRPTHITCSAIDLSSLGQQELRKRCASLSCCLHQSCPVLELHIGQLDNLIIVAYLSAFFKHGSRNQHCRFASHQVLSHDANSKHNMQSSLWSQHKHTVQVFGLCHNMSSTMHTRWHQRVLWRRLEYAKCNFLVMSESCNQLTAKC